MASSSAGAQFDKECLITIVIDRWLLDASIKHNSILAITT